MTSVNLLCAAFAGKGETGLLPSQFAGKVGISLKEVSWI
jgi:hypothetical protein